MLLIFLYSDVIAQIDRSGDSIAVRKVLITMFDGMREGDSAKVRSVFKADVTMFSSYRNRSSHPVLKEEKLSHFLWEFLVN